MVDLSHFPLAQPAPVTCGNRSDLPKKERRHTWASMGRDVRNAGSAGFKEYLIGACVTCGRDEKFEVISASTETEVGNAGAQ